MAYNWKCPYCAHAQTVHNEQTELAVRKFYVSGYKYGDVGIQTHAIVCSNADCRELSLSLIVGLVDQGVRDYRINAQATRLFSRSILPEGAAKPQPECIPTALIEDYQEACLIADLSPKASATLSRRCLQGMIRDFCKIQRGTLDLEIKALRDAVSEGAAPPGVTAEAVEGIDHVRQIGNIGAHMEKDIDLIIPVDPTEAKALISLIEMLFDEWYVAREQRRQRLAAIASIATEKKALKSPIAAMGPASAMIAAPPASSEPERT